MNGPANPDTASQWFWDRYWQADRVAACRTDVATGNYDSAIRGAWEEFFAGCADGARLLDIGTGNGAVAVIAFETAARDGKHFDIHGVDRADIDPARHVHAAAAALAATRFHAHTLAESLPFPAAHFDAITGQYALEYTDMERSLRELRRVARPGARLRFVLHARDARPVSAAASILNDIVYVTDTLGLLGKARALMRAAFAFEHAEHYDAKLEARARTAREVYQAAARAADERYARSLDKPLFENLLGSVHHAWEHRSEFTLQHILTGLDAIETEIRAHCARLENMCAVALTRAGAEQLSGRFRAAGFEKLLLAEFPAPDRQDFLGWELTAQRDARREDGPSA